MSSGIALSLCLRKNIKKNYWQIKKYVLHFFCKLDTTNYINNEEDCLCLLGLHKTFLQLL